MRPLAVLYQYWYQYRIVDRGVEVTKHRRAAAGPALRGAFVGATTALIACGGVSAALAATQSGIEEVSPPVARPSATQAGVEWAQKASAPQVVEATFSQPPVQTKQPGLVEAATPTRDVKQDDKGDEVRELADEVSADQVPQAPAQRVQSPPSASVQRAPSPPAQQAPSYPVQQAPAPIRQAPAPAPAPAQQAPAPAPAPEITIDLGGRGPVVPQAPILPKQLHIG